MDLGGNISLTSFIWNVTPAPVFRPVAGAGAQNKLKHILRAYNDHNWHEVDQLVKKYSEHYADFVWHRKSFKVKKMRLR